MEDAQTRPFFREQFFLTDNYDGRRAKWAPNDLIIVVYGGRVKHRVCLATPILGGHWNFELWSPCPLDEKVVAVAWSPDSTLLAVATDAVHGERGDRVHIWQVSPRTLVRTLLNDVWPAARTKIADLSWTADGKYLASTAIDVWHVASGKLVWTVFAPTDDPNTFRNKMMTSCVDAIAWSPYVDAYGRYIMCINEANCVELLRFSPADATLTSLYMYFSQVLHASCCNNALVWRQDGLCVFFNDGNAIKRLTAVPWSPRHHFAFTSDMCMYTLMLVTAFERPDRLWPRELVFLILEHLCALL
jgi:WD40 repeat protein